MGSSSSKPAKCGRLKVASNVSELIGMGLCVLPSYRRCFPNSNPHVTFIFILTCSTTLSLKPTQDTRLLFDATSIRSPGVTSS